MSDPFKLAGERVADKFRVERFVAEGGYGAVYRAIHESLDRPVALKVLKVPPDLSDSAREAFMANFALEAKTIARLEHPAIVRVIDYGTSPMPGGKLAPWTALEWLDGEPLEARLEARRGEPMAPDEVLALLKPAFDALALAHDEGIAHRDIKPANMMLVKGKRETSLRMLDFGIAKLMDRDDSAAASSGMTSTRGAPAGYSPQYAAPEQVTGSRTGPWTDVHALALVVVECLVGRTAYAHGDLTELYADILGEPRPSPARLGFDVGAWEPVLARALALRPAERFANAAALYEALAAACPQSQKAAPRPALRAPNAALGGTLASPLVAPITGPTATFAASPAVAASPASPATPDRRWVVSGLAAVALLALGGVVWRGRAAAPEGTSTTAAAAPTAPAPSSPRGGGPDPAQAPPQAPVAAPPVAPAPVAAAVDAGAEALPSAPSPASPERPSRSSRRRRTTRPAGGNDPILVE